MKTRIITGVLAGALLVATASGADVPSKLLNGSDPATDPLVQETRAAGHTYNDVLTVRRLDRGRSQLAVGVGAKVACMTTRNYDGSGSVGCAPAALDKPAVSVDLLPGANYQVSGMVSNAVQGVAVNGAPVNVENGVFSVEVETPRTVSWAMGGKTYSQAISG